MAESDDTTRKVFTYEAAAALLSVVQQLTGSAVAEVEALEASGNSAEDQAEAAARYQEIVGRWAAEIIELGIEVKGLWLVDFDNGSGYYCWKHPEPALQFFHGYEEGFGGRVELN